MNEHEHSIQNALSLHHAEQDRFREKIAALAATARDSTLDDEARYAALMRHTALNWHCRVRFEGEADQVPDWPVRDHQPRARLYPSALAALADVAGQPRKLSKPKPKPPATTMKQYVEEILRQVDRHGVGLSYGEIRQRVLARFPTVTRRGQWYGRVSVLELKEIARIAGELRKSGVALPDRPWSERDPSRPPAKQFRGRRAKQVRGRLGAIEAPDTLCIGRCAECGKPFKPGHPMARNVVYCSPYCRRQATNRHQNARYRRRRAGMAMVNDQ